MRILIWHVHGSWTTAFVRGHHTYLVPVTPDRGPDGRGRARTFHWPDRAVEVPPERLRDEGVDAVVLQRPRDLELAQAWLGRRPGRDVPAVYVEHDTPRGDVPHTRHPLADRDDIPLVHVTAFNDLMWDSGRAPTTVIEHGVPDPGHRYRGYLPRAAVIINEPVRRGRLTGTDLLPRIAREVPVDLFGMKVAALTSENIHTHEDLRQDRLHDEIARRRVYVHPYRWTSLGLALIEAMLLGLPVAALACTAALDAVPEEAGALCHSAAGLARAAGSFTTDPAWARQTGKAARAHALSRFGLGRFLDDWDRLLQEVTR